MNRIPYILFGIITVGYGLSIYIGLPLSLLQMNKTLLLSIFVAILMGMLFGVTILVTNLQAVLEVILLYLMLFWEKTSMRSLIRKNLIAHRKRNKLTQIIYSLTLGSIIFLLVCATLQIKIISSLRISQTADLTILGRPQYLFAIQDETGLLFANKTDPVLIRYKDQIKDFGYTSIRAISYQKDARSCYSDRSKLLESKVKDPKKLCEIAIQAITPSKFFDNQL